jgi:hypothetical protein
MDVTTHLAQAVVKVGPRLCRLPPPKGKRRREERADVRVVASDWLDPDAYRAIYNTPTEALNSLI